MAKAEVDGEEEAVVDSYMVGGGGEGGFMAAEMAAQKAADKPEKSELFYTPGAEALQAARKRVSSYSFPVALERLKRARARRESEQVRDPLPCPRRRTNARERAGAGPGGAVRHGPLPRRGEDGDRLEVGLAPLPTHTNAVVSQHTLTPSSPNTH